MEIQNAILNRRCSLRPEQLNKSKKVVFQGSRSVDVSRRNSSAKGPGPGGTSQMVAIDSKIEQAMDLVKTHLMFAVREEVEVLRAKIIELETTDLVKTHLMFAVREEVEVLRAKIIELETTVSDFEWFFNYLLS
uniref:Uncharacterized protein n=1 Tax=Ascaris lumbricoides TaxID=6252 RepID=A0A0M3IFJ0_ASCLU